MKRNLFTYLSNITLIIGGLLGGYVIVDFIVLKSRLPEGACPLTDNKPIIFTAIIFLALSFVLSIFEQRKKKKDGLKSKADTEDISTDSTDGAPEDSAKDADIKDAGGLDEPDNSGEPLRDEIQKDEAEGDDKSL